MSAQFFLWAGLIAVVIAGGLLCVLLLALRAATDVDEETLRNDEGAE